MWKIHVSKGSLGHIQLHLPSIEQYTPLIKASKRSYAGVNGSGERNCFLVAGKADCSSRQA
jgi:hypothetical protein